MVFFNESNFGGILSPIELTIVNNVAEFIFSDTEIVHQFSGIGSSKYIKILEELREHEEIYHAILTATLNDKYMRCGYFFRALLADVKIGDDVTLEIVKESGHSDYLLAAQQDCKYELSVETLVENLTYLFSREIIPSLGGDFYAGFFEEYNDRYEKILVLLFEHFPNDCHINIKRILIDDSTIGSLKVWTEFGGNINTINPLVITKCFIYPCPDNELILQAVAKLGYDFSAMNEKFKNHRAKQNIVESSKKIWRRY